jgi:hypothetical protein
MRFSNNNVLRYNDEMLNQENLIKRYRYSTIALGVTTGLFSITTGVLGYFAYMNECYDFF